MEIGELFSVYEQMCPLPTCKLMANFFSFNYRCYSRFFLGVNGMRWWCRWWWLKVKQNENFAHFTPAKNCAKIMQFCALNLQSTEARNLRSSAPKIKSHFEVAAVQWFTNSSILTLNGLAIISASISVEFGNHLHTAPSSWARTRNSSLAAILGRSECFMCQKSIKFESKITRFALSFRPKNHTKLPCWKILNIIQIE